MPASTQSKSKRAPRRRTSARLRAYGAKRNLAASGEPGGGATPASRGPVRRFVIQMHDATRLHYDFRLEMDGVYRSWAVPKGLPVKPGERNLAVEVEDHPLEYGSFEGIIPEGNYGAGTVMLWDRGHYTVSGPSAEQAYAEGKLHLALAGEKCIGEWTLVRMHPRAGEKRSNWLLIKNSAAGDRAGRGTGSVRDRSVLSGRSLEQIASGERAAAAKRAARTTPPAKTRAAGRAAPTSPVAPRRGRRASQHLEAAAFIAPMKALSVADVPDGRWQLEIKFDGYRAIAVLNEGRVELWSRNHKPMTGDYPEVVAALRRVPCSNAVIDGEIVALDESGRSRFQLLQNRGAGGAPIVYYAFDLLHRDGRSLLDTPIEERQMALEVLLGRGQGPVRFSPVFNTSPADLLAAARRQGLEGIIAKTRGSRYEPDRRSGTWLKCKLQGEQEFVIGGFTAPRHTREHFGAILVGFHEGGRLLYAGKVGTGFDRRQLAALHREFQRHRTDACPFANLPAARRSRYGTGMTAPAMRQVTWLKPELVAQVRFTEWTHDGSLRHPVFLGLRSDKAATEVRRET